MKSVIPAFIGTVGSGATVYGGLSFANYIGLSATENQRQQLISTGGTLKNLRVESTVAPGATKSIVVTLRKNGAATALTATLSNTDTQASDTSNSVTVAAGDLVCWEFVASAAHATTALRVSCEFEGSTAKQSILLSNSDGGNFATTYCPASGDDSGVNQTYNPARQTIATAGTIKNLYVKVNAALGGGNSGVWTLYKNGSSTGLTVTISGASDTSGSDTTNSVSVVAGDDIAVQCAGTGVNPSFYKLGMTFVATTSGEFPIIGGTTTNPSASAVNYIPLVAADACAFSASETNFDCTSVMTIKNLYTKVTTAPGVGKSYAITVRVNGADSALVATISDANTTANDTADVTVAAFDNLNISTTPSGTPTAPADISWGVTGFIAADAATFIPQVIIC